MTLTQKYAPHDRVMMGQEVQFEIKGQPDYSALTLHLQPTQSVNCEIGSMMSMAPNLKLVSKFKGGFGRLLTGENLVVNRYSASRHGGGPLTIIPGLPGDIAHTPLDNDVVFLQKGTYLASSENIKTSYKYQGVIKGLFSGGGLFLIECRGVGDLFFSGNGGLLPIDVRGDFVVDTNHIVGFTEGLDYRITSIGGYKSLFFSGEGLVAQFSGVGKVWVQTHNLAAFVSWLNPFRRLQRPQS